MPAATPIFHVGYHKTATTWFQTRVYPAVANAQLIAPERVRDLLVLPRALEFDPEPVRAELAAAGRRPIVCHEELSGNIHSGGLLGCHTADVARRIEAVAPDAQIVIFIRNQIDMVVAAYRQYVRVGGTHSLDRYLAPRPNRPNRSPLFDLGHLDYRLTVEHYAARFGPERVAVYPFEELREDSEAFLDRYLGEHGLTLGPAPIDHRPQLAGYGDRLLGVARALNRFSREELPYKRYVVHVPRLHERSRRLLDRLNGSAALGRRRQAAEVLGADRAAEIHARFAESNRRLAEDFDLPLERCGYPLA